MILKTGQDIIKYIENKFSFYAGGKVHKYLPDWQEVKRLVIPHHIYNMDTNISGLELKKLIVDTHKEQIKNKLGDICGHD